jgi:hypothetical protein
VVENRVWEISKLVSEHKENVEWLNETYFDYSSAYPSMMTKIGLTIVEEKTDTKNVGVVRETYVEFHKLLDATQFMEKYEPKKHWKVIQFRVDEVGVLL